MNKRIILYIAALLLSLMFICGVAFNQEPVQQEKQTMEEESNVEVETNQSEQMQELEEIEDIEVEIYQEYQIPTNDGFKSYMSYKSITAKSSSQYKLQSQFAYTGEYGIRQVDNRFCIAIGTFSGATIGTYVDLVLDNGTVIPCILSDFKADIHTDSSNKVTLHNGCVSEFVVDKAKLYKPAEINGDISHCNEEWNSPVKAIRVYEKNIFDGE